MPQWLKGYRTFVLLGIYIGMQWLPRVGIEIPP